MPLLHLPLGHLLQYGSEQARRATLVRPKENPVRPNFKDLRHAQTLPRGRIPESGGQWSELSPHSAQAREA